MKGFNTKTKVDKELKITDIIKTVKLTKEEKTQLKSIESITLAHVLSSETTGLVSSNNVSLVYIFTINVVGESLPMAFIKAFDKKTKAHTIFELKFNESFLYLATSKKISEKIMLGDYFSIKNMIEYTYSNEENVETLNELYLRLLSMVFQCKPNKNDTPETFYHRKKEYDRINSQIKKLEKQRDTEKQPNKKIKLNEEILKMKNSRR